MLTGKDFKGNIATATAYFQKQEGKDVGEQYTHTNPPADLGSTAEKNTQEAMGNQSGVKTTTQKIDELFQNGGWVDEEGQFRDNEGNIRQDLSNYGDYLYGKGNEIKGYYENGTAVVEYGGKEYPANNAPKKGDVLAEQKDAKFVTIDGNNYVIDPEDPKKCWYTTKPLSKEALKEQLGKEMKQIVEENDDLLLMMMGGKEGGTGLNKEISKVVNGKPGLVDKGAIQVR